jgi:hypothetical protein
MSVLVTLVGAVLALVVIVWLLREPVLRGNSPSWLRPFYLWFFPPVGFYERIKLVPIDFSAPGNFEFQFSPRYVGDHEIGVIVDRKITMPKKSYDFDFSGVLGAAQGETKLWSRTVGLGPLPWWDANSNGFVFARFSVPTDFPLDHPIHFFLKIETGSKLFDREYGKATVYVNKKPEK